VKNLGNAAIGASALMRKEQDFVLMRIPAELKTKSQSWRKDAALSQDIKIIFDYYCCDWSINLWRSYFSV